MIKVVESGTHSLRKAVHPTSVAALPSFNCQAVVAAWGGLSGSMYMMRFLSVHLRYFHTEFLCTINLYAASRIFISFQCSVRIIPHRTDSLLWERHLAVSSIKNGSLGSSLQIQCWKSNKSKARLNPSESLKNSL